MDHGKRINAKVEYTLHHLYPCRYRGLEPDRDPVSKFLPSLHMAITPLVAARLFDARGLRLRWLMALGAPAGGSIPGSMCEGDGRSILLDLDVDTRGLSLVAAR